MFRLTLALWVAMICQSSFAQDLALKGFNDRFTLVKNAEGRVVAIKLKKAITTFTLRPFLEQIKSDLLLNQKSLVGISDGEREAEVDDMLNDMGLNPYDKSADGVEEAQKVKESLMNVGNIDVQKAFVQLENTTFWQEFETKLHEAMMFIDPTILTNHDDARFFYKRQVTYKVVEWALNEAKKRFSNIPVLNIASYVIVRVHDMMLEQRYFSHNMLLHYFETIPEGQFGMTKEEVDRAVSSIYEYRIGLTGISESNKAAADWLNYGMDNFYLGVRSGNAKIKSWSAPMANVAFKDIKKLDFAFAQVTEKDAKKIYHLHINAHQFSQKPALAYDYSSPSRVKRNRALMSLGGVGLGFIKMPSWIKSNVENFLKSMYVEQVRMEGALIGYFESTGNKDMIKGIYAQRANFYIVE
jgi:hypothetical protein